MTNRISNFVRSNYKVSLYLRTDAPNQLICIQIEIVWSLGRAVRLNLGTDEESRDSQTPVSFDSGVMW